MNASQNLRMALGVAFLTASANAAALAKADCATTRKFIASVAYDLSAVRLANMEAELRSRNPESAKEAVGVWLNAKQEAADHIAAGATSVIKASAKSSALKAAVKALIVEARAFLAGTRADEERTEEAANLEVEQACPT